MENGIEHPDFYATCAFYAMKFVHVQMRAEHEEDEEKEPTTIVS